MSQRRQLVSESGVVTELVRRCTFHTRVKADTSAMLCPLFYEKSPLTVFRTRDNRFRDSTYEFWAQASVAVSSESLAVVARALASVGLNLERIFLYCYWLKLLTSSQAPSVMTTLIKAAWADDCERPSAT